MQDARLRWALAAIGLLVFGGSGLALFAAHRTAPPPVVITSLPAPRASIGLRVSATPRRPLSVPRRHANAAIYVHVAGAVKRPSMYALAPGSRVMQAIQAAGGPTTRADVDAINLAERVRDSEKVYIPVKQPQAIMSAPPGNVIGHASVIPIDDAPAPAFDQPSAQAGPRTSSNRHSRSRAGRAGKLTSPTQGQVNLNTADAAQLQRLPGIGPAMAARILAYREQAHGFRALDELQEVGGIGPKKFAKIAPLVTLH